MSEYTTELTYELRQRGVVDGEIAEILSELPSATDEDLTREFGEAKAYAASFPKGAKKSRGWKIITATVVVGLAIVLGRVLGVILSGGEHSIIHSLLFLGGLVVAVIVASIVAAAVDRRPVKTAR